MTMIRPAQLDDVRDGRQSPAAFALFRGVGRLLGAHLRHPLAQRLWFRRWAVESRRQVL